MVKDVKLVEAPKTESELIADLKFLYHNRSDTVDQFLDEALAIIDQHVNERLGVYQETVLNEATRYFQGEMAGVLLKTRQDYRKQLSKERLERPKEGDIRAW